MLDEESAKQVVHTAGLSQTMRLLLCLAVGDQPKAVADVLKIATKAGIRGVKNWNISQLLGQSNGKAIKTPAGWELSPSGKDAIEPLVGPLLSSKPPKAATSLRKLLPGIKDADTQAFVEEAISCLEHTLLRASVVLSWVGAVSLLYNHVIANVLPAFNAEAKRRNLKWKEAATRDDLALMKEHDFLQILEAISVIGKNVKTELEGCLKFRNACGHPNSLQIGEQRVSSHIEILALNVFAKF